MSTRPSPRVLVGGAAVVVLVIPGLAWLATRPHPAPGGEGFLGRTRPPAIDTTVHQLSDGCFDNSRLQYAGRDASQKDRYVLTLTLKSDPSGIADLVSTLDRKGCATAVGEATRSAQDRLKSDPRFGGLAVAYRTSAGTRVVLP